MPQISQLNPDITSHELMKVVAKEWKNLEDKSNYQNQYAIALKEYKELKETLEKNLLISCLRKKHNRTPTTTAFQLFVKDKFKNLKGLKKIDKRKRFKVLSAKWALLDKNKNQFY